MKFYCDLCGIKFESKSGNTKYCPECRKRRKEKPMVECQECGKVFRKTSGNVRYCPECRAKRAEHKSVKCEMCGKVFVKKKSIIILPGMPGKTEGKTNGGMSGVREGFFKNE